MTDTDDGGEPTPELAADAQGRFPVPEYDDLPVDLQERIAEETEKAGFTPNVFAALAYRPAQFRAFVAYHDALVEETALDREEVEMIVVAVSGRNHCYYCNVAHGALVRIYARDPHLADQLVANYRQADVSNQRLFAAGVEVRVRHPVGGLPVLGDRDLPCPQLRGDGVPRFRRAVLCDERAEEVERNCHYLPLATGALESWAPGRPCLWLLPA